MGCSFNQANRIIESKLVNMPAAGKKKPVKTVREAISIRNRDKEFAIFFQDPSYFFECGLKTPEMLETVVTNHQIEASRRKRKDSAVRTNTQGTAGWKDSQEVRVDRDDRAGTRFIREASCA